MTRPVLQFRACLEDDKEQTSQEADAGPDSTASAVLGGWISKSNRQTSEPLS